MLCKIVRSQNNFQWFRKKFGALEFVRKLAPPSTNQFSNLTDSLFRHSRFCAGFQGSLPDFTFDVCVCFFFSASKF